MERLSFSLTVATLFTSTSWTLYGLQLRDYYIMVRWWRDWSETVVWGEAEHHVFYYYYFVFQVPNTPGIFTSIIRFFLFWWFGAVIPNKSSYKLIQIWERISIECDWIELIAFSTFLYPSQMRSWFPSHQTFMIPSDLKPLVKLTL